MQTQQDTQPQLDGATLRDELRKLFDAAQEVIDALERHDYDGAEVSARYIKLKAMALAPQEPQDAAPTAGERVGQ